MKKYRLIKKYPNSPELGFITDKTMYFPEDYPEFWEEIIEIPVGTKIRDIYYLAEYLKKENGWFYIPALINITHEIDESQIGEGKRFKIVEELIYPIGTKFKHKLDDTTIYTLDKIEKDGVCISWSTYYEKETAHFSISSVNKFFKEGFWIKYEEPLFITEDGKEIRQGDDYYVVCDYKIIPQKCGKTFIQSYKDGKVFSTKEAAEEHVILNKPCLSLKEVGQFYHRLLDFSNGNSKGLRKLVEKKLNVV